jgi:hypothetical protein
MYFFEGEKGVLGDDLPTQEAPVEGHNCPKQRLCAIAFCAFAA